MSCGADRRHKASCPKRDPLKKLMQRVSSGRVSPWLGAIADGAPFRRCRRAWCVGECNDGVGSRGDHFIVPNLTGNAAWLRHASLQDGAGKPAVRWETGGGDTSSRCRAATTPRRQKFGVPREDWPSRKLPRQLACAQLWLARRPCRLSMGANLCQSGCLLSESWLPGRAARSRPAGDKVK